MHRLALMMTLLFGAPLAMAQDLTTPFATPDRQWRLVDWNGTAFEGTSTIAFPTPGRVAGRALCNRFNGAAEWSAGALRLGPLATTRMACPEAARETAVLAALGQVTGGGISGDRLVLTLEGGGRMIYAMLPGSPFARPDIEWRLVELNGTAFEEESTILFPEPGRVAGKAVCNRFAGTASWSDGVLQFGPLGMTMMACPDADGERAVADALAAVVSGGIEEDRLILRLQDGGRMIYLPADD